MKLGLVGSDISRSLSPRIFQQLHPIFPVEYDLCQVSSDVDLDETLLSLRKAGYRGVNITRPFKVRALASFATSELAKKVGAVNWIDFESGRSDNTDVLALIEMLRPHRPSSARIFGMGGAARAAHVALQELGCPKIVVSNRSFKAEAAKEFPAAWDDSAPVEWLIQATPERGASPQLRGLLDLTQIGVLEMVYDPLVTPLLSWARGRGLVARDGLEMLIRQALLGFGLWTGRPAPEYAQFRAQFEMPTGIQEDL